MRGAAWLLGWLSTAAKEDVGGSHEGWCPWWWCGREGNSGSRDSEPRQGGEDHVSGDNAGVVSSELLDGVVGGLHCDAPLGVCGGKVKETFVPEQLSPPLPPFPPPPLASPRLPPLAWFNASSACR